MARTRGASNLSHASMYIENVSGIAPLRELCVYTLVAPICPIRISDPTGVCMLHIHGQFYAYSGVRIHKCHTYTDIHMSQLYIHNIIRACGSF